MRIIVVMVMSLDGKTTDGNNSNIHTWSSKEDSAYFTSLIQENNLIIMGKKTYDAAKHFMKHGSNKLRVVLTHKPENATNETIPDQLEFTHDNPTMLIKALEHRGYTQALLVGGEQINHVFFKQNLVTDLWVTVEPKILGSGNGLGGNIRCNLKLKTVETLNNEGTLLCKYIVTKSNN